MSNEPDIPHEWDISDTGEADTQALRDRIARLETELADANSRALRTMADFQNYQKRSYSNEQIAKATGIAGVVGGLVSVIDHFDLALGQDTSKVSAEQIVGGVKVIREEMLRVLQGFGLTVINPKPGDDFVPGIHEAIMQQQAEGIAPGKIVATFQAGYSLAGAAAGGADKVIRPAKVSVAPTQ
ncbi:MAG: nucleotide exchange factor GrpE [Phycisphaerales bacterium]|nr:nucleotide exchange factor GrpE [Planctomycetota bacterium]